MDIYRLDPATFLPMGLVEGYNSMVWTERYAGQGEFEFKTSKVLESLPLLPRGTFISLRDSLEVMMVETTDIAEDDDGYPELTVKGRTLDLMLEHRVLQPMQHGVSWTTYEEYDYFEVALLLLWTHLVNTSGQDPARYECPIDQYTALPNVVVTDSVRDPIHTFKKVWFEAGQVAPIFRDLLSLAYFGVRGIRPVRPSGTVVSFNTTDTVGERGDIYRTPVSNIRQLCLDIYDGTYRTIEQTQVEPVIFHYEAGHITTPQYLFSIKEYRNIALVYSSIWTTVMSAENIPADISGFDRRVLAVDAGVMDIDDPNAADVQYQKGAVELGKHRMVRLFDGEISPVTPYVYGKDYFLGDKVSLIAKYGFQETMLVSEYIRTEDQEGDRGYPGLSVVLD